MLFVKNLTFLQPFFLGKIGREKLFSDVLDRIIAFLDNKNNNIKRSPNCIFPKGLVHDFSLKLALS